MAEGGGALAAAAAAGGAEDPGEGARAATSFEVVGYLAASLDDRPNANFGSEKESSETVSASLKTVACAHSKVSQSSSTLSARF